MVSAADQTHMGTAELDFWPSVGGALPDHRGVVRIGLGHAAPEKDRVGDRAAVSFESDLQCLIHAHPVRAEE